MHRARRSQRKLEPLEDARISSIMLHAHDALTICEGPRNIAMLKVVVCLPLSYLASASAYTALRTTLLHSMLACISRLCTDASAAGDNSAATAGYLRLISWRLQLPPGHHCSFALAFYLFFAFGPHLP